LKVELLNIVDKYANSFIKWISIHHVVNNGKFQASKYYEHLQVSL